MSFVLEIDIAVTAISLYQNLKTRVTYRGNEMKTQINICGEFGFIIEYEKYEESFEGDIKP